MKGVLFGLAVGLALAGCSSPQEIEDHARAKGFEERLPEGCKLKVPGYVNGDLVVVVYCDKRITTSAMRKWTTSHYNAQTQQTEYEHHRNHVIYIGPEEA